MIKELKDTILLKVLPEEKFFTDDDSLDTKKIILGWNWYRDELLKLLKLK